MASLRVSSLLLPSSSSTCSKKVNAAIHLPKPSKLHFSRDSNDVMIKRSESHHDFISSRSNNDGYMATSTPQLLMGQPVGLVVDDTRQSDTFTSSTYQQMRLILEAVADRVEMHSNMGKQRDNWNSLLLNSVNAMTLAATTMAGLACVVVADGGAPVKLSSTVLFGATTAILLVMNKIQPSQLAEEQRNATRLFKQLKREIQSVLDLRAPMITEADVEETMERVLALDQAYPLALLGKMIDKFPKKFVSAEWWPNKNNNKHRRTSNKSYGNPQKGDMINGWSKDLEEEMRAIVDVLKTKDEDDYLRLGNTALKVNKVLAISGPLLTGVAAAASAFSGPTGGAVAVTAGAMAAAVNTFEHGGQVGMVLEMYRNCGGFFRLLSESIESTLEEKDSERRETGELFERKVALKLGRSVSELRDLAKRSVYSTIKGSDIEEFGSKLF